MHISICTLKNKSTHYKSRANYGLCPLLWFSIIVPVFTVVAVRCSVFFFQLQLQYTLMSNYLEANFGLNKWTTWRETAKNETNISFRSSWLIGIYTDVSSLFVCPFSICLQSLVVFAHPWFWWTHLEPQGITSWRTMDSMSALRSVWAPFASTQLSDSLECTLHTKLTSK